MGGPRASGAFAMTHADGSLNGPFGLMLHMPAVGAALSGLGETIRFGSSLDGRTRELAILTVGRVMDSSYEVWAHERVALAMGFGAAEVEALVAGEWQPANERDGLTVEATLAMARGAALPAETAQSLIGEFGPTGATELVTLVGYYVTLAQLMRTFGVEAPAG
ncbi:MAG: hypothetical protein RLZ14_390 [Actinomycetota bacterium]